MAQDPTAAEADTTASTQPTTRSRLTRRVMSLGLRELLVAAGALALLVRLPFIVGPFTGTLASDSGVYLGMAHDLIDGNGFATGGELRTPGYAVLLALLSPLPGSTAAAAVVFQHLLGVALVVVSTWAAWRFFGRGAALVTGVVAALSPVLVNLEGDVLPDFFVAVCAVAGALLLARAVERDRPATRWLVAAGITLGIGALVKPVGQSLLVLAVVPLLVAPRRPAVALRAGVIFAVVFLLTISPWLVRNAVEYGDFRMSVQDGAALWLREFDWDKRPIPTDTADGRLAKRLYDQEIGKSIYTQPTDTYQRVYAALIQKHGYTTRDAMALQRRVALQAIRDAPKVYVRGTVSITKTLAGLTHDLTSPRVSLNEKIDAKKPALPTTPSFKAFDVAQKLMRAWWVLSLGLWSILILCVVGTRRRRAAALSLGLAWTAVTVSTAATTWPDPRYAAEVVPLLWIAGSAGIAFVIGFVVAQGRRLAAR